MNLVQLKRDLAGLLSSLQYNNEKLYTIKEVLQPQISKEETTGNEQKDPEGLIEELFQLVHVISSNLNYQMNTIGCIQDKILDDEIVKISSK